MNENGNQRNEKRLHYNWPMRYAKDFGQVLTLGEMVEVSSWGGAFVCNAGEHCPQIGQQITTLFSVPRFGVSSTYDMASYKRTGRICRVESVDRNSCCVAIQFVEPLYFKPGEQDISESDARQRLHAVAG